MEARIELARLDERIKGIHREMAHQELAYAAALKIASEELARRLDVLNHAHEEAEEARRQTVPRETFDAKVNVLAQNIEALKLDAREAHGKLWLPMVIVASLAASVAAAVVKLLFS